ncbi:inositol monophosphatase family protein [Streptomyces sp. NPDC087440]|uniref:inositol monophosphatase family protein n=1 Tax=Streptomyces sp. NPDC087440 TaxID=3365790 RepID=UPI0037F52E69
MWIDEVTDILREAAAEAILPRHRALTEGEITEKTPGEVVTVADREAEALITRRLRAVHDVPVVGEEAAAADPALLHAVRGAPQAWLVDPLDGTPNFVAGRDDYAVMAALVRAGETVAAWILQPATGVAYVAERGSGAWRTEGPGRGREATPDCACLPSVQALGDPPPQGLRRAAAEPAGATPPHGEPVREVSACPCCARGGARRIVRGGASGDPAELRGAALTGFLSPAARAHVEASASRVGALSSGTRCAGVDYPRLASGELDFLLYHRTLPWDHAPGALLVAEAGGVVRRPDDASAYRPSDDRSGLIAAADTHTWRTVRDLLLPPFPRKAHA